MITRCAGLLLALLSIHVAYAQVEIPAAYKSHFPYHTGHTAFEINVGKEGKFHKTCTMDPEDLDTNGMADVSHIIQAFMNKQAVSAGNDTCVTIVLPAGKLRIQNTLEIPSNMVLKGQGKTTVLLLQTGENKHGIHIGPRNHGDGFSFRLKASVARGDKTISIDRQDYQQYLEQYGQLRYIVLQKLDDAKLLTSGWAKGSVREHFYVTGVELTGTSAVVSLGHPLAALEGIADVEDIRMTARTAFSGDSALTRVYSPDYVLNAGVMCMQLLRIDSTASQTSNIYLDQAYNCIVSAVDSRQTNYSHICINNSAFNLVKRCRISGSFGYGGGGRGYGIVMQMGSSSNVVMDNHLEKLRHSILLQAGANGNVIYANWSVSPFWEESLMPADAAGDLVLHGNYVYSNLFEMNNVQQVVIDNSHGRNGPFNMFYRNRIANYGILMSASNGSDSQVFVGNEITSPDLFKGLYVLKDKGHFEYGNRVKTSVMPPQTHDLYPYFMWRPDCKKSHRGIRAICFPAAETAPYGAPFFDTDDTLPAAAMSNNRCHADYDRQFENLTNVTDAESIQQFAVYPNPVYNSFVVENADEGVLSMYNAQGRLVREWRITAGRNGCDVAGFPPGMYLLRLQLVSGGIQTARIVLR